VTIRHGVRDAASSSADILYLVRCGCGGSCSESAVPSGRPSGRSFNMARAVGRTTIVAGERKTNSAATNASVRSLSLSLSLSMVRLNKIYVQPSTQSHLYKYKISRVTLPASIAAAAAAAAAAATSSCANSTLIFVVSFSIQLHRQLCGLCFYFPLPSLGTVLICY